LFRRPRRPGGGLGVPGGGGRRLAGSVGLRAAGQRGGPGRAGARGGGGGAPPLARRAWGPGGSRAPEGWMERRGTPRNVRRGAAEPPATNRLGGPVRPPRGTRGSDKPNSVSCQSRTALIPLTGPLPAGSSGLPGDPPRRGEEPVTGPVDPPIWPCSARGLPCPDRRRSSGGLLPHLFTLTRRRPPGGVFSVALSLALPRLGVTQRAPIRSSDFPRPRNAGPRAPAASSATLF